MIVLTRLNDIEFTLNCDLIEVIESTPDTTITMTTGRKYIARESVDEIIGRILEYKQKIFGQF